MEPQDPAARELQALRRRLCYISSSVCAVCLVCLATTVALFLTTQDSCPCRRTDYAQLKWNGKKKNSTILWKGPINGMQYQDGNLIILSEGLYFINCRLHFLVNECLAQHGDIYTHLDVNGRPEYEVLSTVLPSNDSKCRFYIDQHLSLHIRLNAQDKVSVLTDSHKWLDEEMLPKSIIFEAVRL